jgi:hypothetical protein
MSGWTHITVEPVNNMWTETPTDKSTQDTVYEYLDDLITDLPEARHREEPHYPTIEWPSRGEDCVGIATTILNECENANRVLVVAANDTTDAGTGWLYVKRNGGQVEKVATKNGYEGARGKDVTGYFKEEYNITGRASR